MTFFLLISFAVLANLIMWCHFGTPKNENYEQTFYPMLDFKGITGKIYNFDIKNNKFILAIELDEEMMDVIVHSKSRRTYENGEKATIIEQSDSLYFIE